MSDENSFKHNEQTSSSEEVRTKTASFMHQSSILVAWINDGKPSFLLWLRLRRLVVFVEGIWGCSRCNSAMDFFWVVKLPGLHDGRLWRVFSFKIIPFNGTLYEFKGFHSGPCQVLAAPFVSRYIFQDGGIGTSTSFGGRSFIHCFVERVERLRMFIHSDRVKVLYCFVWNYREPGNMYLLEMTMNLLLCFVCLCFTGLGIIRILSRCWRKNAKIFVKMDTECWKLLVK